VELSPIKWAGPWAGPHNPVWAKNEKQIAATIKKMGLKPLSKEEIAVAEKAAPQLTTTATVIPGFSIGIPREWHLHFQGNIYKINQQQWDSFSAAILKNIGEQISKAKNVSFENALNLAGQAYGITG
jgi:hypothetical protein